MRYLASLVVTGLVLVASAHGAAPSLGPPHKACGEFEYLTNQSCIINTRYLTLGIAPHKVGIEDAVVVTATVNLGPIQAPPYAPFTVAFDLKTLGIGTRVGACPSVSAQTGRVVTCTFRPQAVTRGWRTYQLSVGTSQGQAESRDYLAVIDDRPPPRKRLSLPGSRDGRRQRANVAMPRGADLLVAWTGPPPMISVDNKKFLGYDDAARMVKLDVRDWDRVTVATGAKTRIKISSNQGEAPLKIGPKTTVSIKTSPLVQFRYRYFSQPNGLPLGW